MSHNEKIFIEVVLNISHYLFIFITKYTNVLYYICLNSLENKYPVPKICKILVYNLYSIFLKTQNVHTVHTQDLHHPIQFKLMDPYVGTLNCRTGWNREFYW
jgi:hypothetical protein